MSAIAAIVLDAAAGLAVPFIKKILSDRIGGTGGEIAGELADEAIDIIAEKAGVQPADLPKLAQKEPAAFEKAVVAAEPETADLVLARLEQQKATHAFLTSDKPTPKWVPAWQWFLMFLWGFNGPVVAVANFVAGTNIQAIGWADLVWLTVIYQGLNMGGHTALRFAREWKARP